MITVSYTHLDVYKRQIIECARYIEIGEVNYQYTPLENNTITLITLIITIVTFYKEQHHVDTGACLHSQYTNTHYILVPKQVD